MTVTYLPPMTRSTARPGDSLLREAVKEGPGYGRGPRSSRWHLVRSAVDRIHARDGDIRRTYMYWCGQTADGFDTLTADAAPEGEPVCGTCYGRREGHDPDRPDLLFTPMIHPPRLCPGSQTGMYTETAWSRGVCLVCGEPVKLRGFGQWYGGSAHYGAQKHGPGPGLIEPCEFHGWREIVTCLSGDDTVAACRCKTVEVPA